MKNKKVVIVTNNYPPIVCGVGDYSSHLANQLQSKGYEVHVICRFDKSIETGNKFIKVWPIITRMSYSGFREAIRKINDISPDWLLIQYVPYAFHHKGMPLWLPNALRKINRQRTKVAIRIHEPYLRFKWWPVTWFVTGQVQRLIIKQLSRVADRMITSIDLYKEFVDKYSIHPSVIVPIPSNIQPVDTTEKIIEAIRKRVAPNGEMIVSTFGIRNHKLLVEVFQKLLKKYPACKLLVCGAVKDEKLYESVREHVFVTGYLPGEDIFRFLKCSDVFFLPDDVSKQGEGGTSNKSTSLAAALAADLPVIGIKGDMNNELLKKANSIYLEPSLSEQIADRIISIFSSPPKRESFVLWKKYLSWESIIEQYNL